MTVEDRAEIETRRRGGRVAPIVAGLLLAALAFTVSGVFPFRQLIQQRHQLSDTRLELAELTEQNRQLEDEIAALGTNEEIERIAREQYGFVRPGESAYVVVTPQGAESTTTATPSPATGLPWWQRLWNFVTGSDVSGDG